MFLGCLVRARRRAERCIRIFSFKSMKRVQYCPYWTSGETKVFSGEGMKPPRLFHPSFPESGLKPVLSALGCICSQCDILHVV